MFTGRVETLNFVQSDKNRLVILNEAQRSEESPAGREGNPSLFPNDISNLGIV